MAKSKAVVEKKASTSLVGWRGESKKHIQTQRAKLADLPDEGGNFISWGGCSISVGGEERNPLDCIILSYLPERAYFEGEYVEGSKELPTCFSLDMISPHENSKAQQSDKCATCSMNQFGTASGSGKGKACKEGTRIAVLTDDGVEGSIYTSKKMSWSSAKAFKKYVGAFGDEMLYEYPTRITNKPNKGTQYLLSFVRTGDHFDDEQMNLIYPRFEEAERLVALPYPAEEEAPPKPSKSGRAGKFR